MPQALQLLCAGAAQGVVKALLPTWRGDGADLTGRFGAVGAMKQALLAGEPCDVFVATDKMIDELVATGALRADLRTPLGRVRTGIAVRSGAAHPDVSDADALKAAVLASDAIFFPDPTRATAGIHFAAVLRELGIHDEVAPRFRTFESGAVAMRALAECDTPRPIGCTQISEIMYTDGVDAVAALPAQFELATLYTAAASSAADAVLARRFLALLDSAASRELRAAGGFEL